ncbi:TrkA family potassium uptake protein [Romeria aff. gracilis LEGE 07310]|uniref:TrkA family potassium uptake protein n=1 Tax=Vasconcelosia minhoensis LEGE 07310 TaxID=915328 RepID=A0A8J7ANW3_9CYAN|nr:NAD-binding protein [Romeria gracilis]MBE9077904.1 TrkA family potassium uptake protein [Romeria aff. gracilis LEGE 07310]
MYLIVVGAGQEGRNLIDIAIQQGHRVSLIEPVAENARTVLQNHDVQVFNASIATGKILEEAEVKKADALIATTHDDAANLMAMFLGQDYGVKKLVSLINDSSHQHLFERLGVKVLPDAAAIVAQQLFDFCLEDRKNGTQGQS